MKKLSAALFFCAFAFSSQAMAAYTVYCANGKIEVDMRSLDQMISARGKGTYAIKGFSTLTDAKKLADSMGGVGAACKK